MALCVHRPSRARHSHFPSLPNSFTITQHHKHSISYAIPARFPHDRLNNRFFSSNTRIPSPVVAAATSGDEEDSSPGRIFVSDAAIKQKRNIRWDRKWGSSGRATVGVIIGLHLLCILAPFTFTWGAFWVAVGLYLITGLFGITLSYHRNLSHRSFRLPTWLEYSFAYCGVQALQGSPIDWVSTHRFHHQFSDSDKDPHSPLEGFWFSHMGWLFDSKYIITQRCGEANNVGDLQKQPFYRFVKTTYAVHPVVFGAVLYALGGLPYVVWGMGVRVVWLYHITWLVNSACHVWGNQVWKTGDLSRNNWWVAVLTFGEGWHNNHHAFEYSARHGLEWWQIDMTWYAVRALEAAGLATDVKLPTAVHRHRMKMA